MTSNEKPIITIRGERVALGPVDRSMLPDFQRWINALDVQLRLGMDFPGPFTLEDQERWYESATTATSSRSFAIRDGKTRAVVGSTSIQNIDWRNGTGVFGIMIGDPAARGRGLGTETAKLMLDYGFTVLGLHVISLTVAEFNVAGRRAYERAGFREAGRLREHWP
ncbi:MAG TPA: GNAT family protein, partial [Thermomicrobiales bacterium]|nr:GNAT family protein [Thermomicrobiales bacterium]